MDSDTAAFPSGVRTVFADRLHRGPDRPSRFQRQRGKHPLFAGLPFHSERHRFAGLPCPRRLRFQANRVGQRAVGGNRLFKRDHPAAGIRSVPFGFQLLRISDAPFARLRRIDFDQQPFFTVRQKEVPLLYFRIASLDQHLPAYHGARLRTFDPVRNFNTPVRQQPEGTGQVLRLPRIDRREVDDRRIFRATGDLRLVCGLL